MHCRLGGAVARGALDIPDNSLPDLTQLLNSRLHIAETLLKCLDSLIDY